MRAIDCQEPLEDALRCSAEFEISLSDWRVCENNEA